MAPGAAPEVAARSGTASGGEAPSPEPPGAGPHRHGSGQGPLSRADREAVRKRDPEALGALFECYFDRVYALIFRLLGERTLAEDVTQEVFLKVYRAAHRMDPERDPGPWLMAIAHNACRDVWRSNAHRVRRRAVSIDEHPHLGGGLSAGTNDPERDALAGERERLIQEAILRLPEPLRVAIVLHDYQGLGHEEIAAITGVRHAAARKRYSRALAALALLLGKLR
ncbi:MAG TPA: RNA polymerase sigma factor [Candidatus Eisenbacteria bacterium]|jgi:RNA polymerase sigma-70 factor (ECF subfamily)